MHILYVLTYSQNKDVACEAFTTCFMSVHFPELRHRPKSLPPDRPSLSDYESSQDEFRDEFGFGFFLYFGTSRTKSK